MKHMFIRFYTAYSRFMVALATMAGVATFGIMWLIDINAIMRKGLNSPITGSLAITEALLTLVIILPMAYTQFRGEHLRVSIFTNYLPVVFRRVLYTLSSLFSAFFLAIMAYAMCLYALHSFQANEYAWGSNFRFPIYPFKMAVALGIIFFCVQFLLDFVRVGIFGLFEERDGISDESNVEDEA